MMRFLRGTIALIVAGVGVFGGFSAAASGLGVGNSADVSVPAGPERLPTQRPPWPSDAELRGKTGSLTVQREDGGPVQFTVQQVVTVWGLPADLTASAGRQVVDDLRLYDSASTTSRATDVAAQGKFGPAIVKSAESGSVVFSPLPVGLYLVTETDGRTPHGEQFLVTLPYPNPQTHRWEYDLKGLTPKLAPPSCAPNLTTTVTVPGPTVTRTVTGPIGSGNRTTIPAGDATANPRLFVTDQPRLFATGVGALVIVASALAVLTGLATVRRRARRRFLE